MRQYLKSAFAAATAALIAQVAAAETKYQPWQQDGVAKRPYISHNSTMWEKKPMTRPGGN